MSACHFRTRKLRRVRLRTRRLNNFFSAHILRPNNSKFAILKRREVS